MRWILWYLVMADKLHIAEQYMEDVLTGKVKTNKYVRLAVQRHQDDLIHGIDRGLIFDRREA